MAYVTNDDYDPITISDGGRRKLSSALATLSETFDALVVQARESLWAEDSAAAQWMRAYDELPSPADVGEVRLLIGHLFTRCFAAADCVHGAAMVLGGDGTHVALATISRGCIEALAKASYVLTAANAGDGIRRNLRLIRAETRYVGKYSEIDVDGEPVDAEVVRNTVDQVSARFAVTDAASVTQLAAALLDRPVGQSSGRHYYSHISSFAHAEIDSLNIFLARGDLRRPELPLSYAVEWAGMCIGISTLIGWDLVKFFGLDGPILQRWASAVDSTTAALQAVAGRGE